MAIRSADVLTNNILSDPALTQELKDQPDNVLRQQSAIAKASTPYQADRMIYRIVVVCLGATLIIVALGLIGLALYGDKEKIPDGLVAIGSATVGALAGLLAPSPAAPS